MLCEISIMLSLQGGTLCDEQACDLDNSSYICRLCASIEEKIRVDLSFFLMQVGHETPVVGCQHAGA